MYTPCGFTQSIELDDIVTLYEYNTYIYIYMKLYSPLINLIFRVFNFFTLSGVGQVL